MSVPTVTISSEGKAVGSEVEVLSVEVRREVNRVPSAAIEVIDGRVAKSTFPISDGEVFAIGARISVAARYEGDEDATIFEGVVVRHSISAGGGRSVLRVEMKDAAFKLSVVRRSAVYRDATDADAMRQIISDAGLGRGKIPATEPRHAELVQCQATDWDFLLSRADVQGLVIVVVDGTISAVSMAPPTKAASRYEYGLSEIHDLELELDGGHQVAGTEAMGWDAASAAAGAGNPGKDLASTAGNVDGGNVAASLQLPVQPLAHITTSETEELQAWADARLARSRLSLVRGRIVVRGTADVGVMDGVELAGAGTRFNGLLLVSAVVQRVGAEGWRTELELGLSAEAFCYQDQVAEVGATGLLPPVSGLYLGVVEPFEEDPSGDLRLRVSVPGFGAESGALWARLLQPDAGEARGFWVRPEPGDEVVVGFLSDDPRHPVVLGAMFTSAHQPPEEMGEPDEENAAKGWVSRSGASMILRDGDSPSVVVATPGGRRVSLDDGKQSIEVTDGHGNALRMDADGVTLISGSGLKIEASGDVEIAGRNIEMK